MESSKLLLRSLMVAVTVAAGAALSVYFLHEWFHSFFQPAPLVDAFGAVIIVFVTFIGLLAVTFVISRVVPIDPVTSILGNRASQAQIDDAREALGLNDPTYMQFGIYLRDIFIVYVCT